MAKLINATPMRRQRMQQLTGYLKRRLPAARRKVLVEIGSFCGMSTMEFATVFEKVYAIDAWDVSLYPEDSQDAIRLKGQPNLNDAEYTFDHNTKAYPNIVKLKMTSQAAFQNWRELIGCKPTAVYIDAQHGFEGALADIEMWKDVPTSLVMGHDFSQSWPGVTKAVNQVFGKPDLVFSDTSWVYDIEMHLQPGAPMDPHELHQKVRLFASAAPDEFDIRYHFEPSQGIWHVTVKEKADGHEVFGGRGYTVEEANRCCWNDILSGYKAYGYKLSPVFADEAEELRRANS